MVFAARKIGGEEALKLGIVNYVEETHEAASNKIMSLID